MWHVPLNDKWLMAIVVIPGLFMVVLDNTIVSVALPQIQQVFHSDLATITWIATGYFLAQAMFIPVAGYLSDRIGTRRVFLYALGTFMLGSALCSIAPDVSWLIVFRMLQGLGGGGLFPVSFAIVYRVFPPTERGLASSVVGIPVLLAPTLGPTIGGYLMTNFSWHTIFLINLPVGILALLLALVFLKEDGMQSNASHKRFDLPGFLLAMLSSTLLMYGISEANAGGWGNPFVSGLLVSGGVALVAFVITELSVEDPVIDLRLFLNYTFTTANILTWLLATLLFSGMFLLPLFFVHVQKQSPLATGTWLIAQGVALAIGVGLSGILYNRVGPGTLVVSSFFLTMIGTIGLMQLSVSTTGLELQGWLVVRALGLGLGNITLQTLALSVVNNRAMARASSLVNATRQFFSAVGISVLTTYLLQRTIAYGNQVTPFLPTHSLAEIMATCISQQASATFQQCLEVQSMLVMGLNDTFTLAAIGTGAGISLALVVGHDPTR
jgi:EmrB/QacA subfamily drug resistance transporter